MIEGWKGITGYDHDYRVSTLGRVIGTRGFLKPYDNGYGYLAVELRQNGKKKHLRCTSSYNKKYGTGRKSRSDGMKRVWAQRRAAGVTAQMNATMSTGGSTRGSDTTI